MRRTVEAETPEQGAKHRGIDPSSPRAPEHEPAVVVESAHSWVVTADVARELGYRVAVEADPFTIPGLVEAISSHFEEGGHG